MQFFLKNKEKKESIVVIETGMGEIKIKLFENEAPITTSNFKRLVNDGFYNGLIFHRIVNNFVIQIVHQASFIFVLVPSMNWMENMQYLEKL